jgi:hypothetical protein
MKVFFVVVHLSWLSLVGISQYTLLICKAKQRRIKAFSLFLRHKCRKDEANLFHYGIINPKSILIVREKKERNIFGI